MKRLIFSRKRKEIVRSALFSKKYREGIQALLSLPTKKDNEVPLTSLGILYDHLALTYSGSRRFLYEEKARQCYHKALEKNAGCLPAYWGLGRIELLHNKRISGLRYYKMAFNINPDLRKNRFAYAQALMSARHYGQAKKLYLMDWKQYGQSFHISYNLAVLEFIQDHLRNAKKYALIALRLLSHRPKYIRESQGATAWRCALEDIIKKSVE